MKNDEKKETTKEEKIVEDQKNQVDEVLKPYSDEILNIQDTIDFFEKSKANLDKGDDSLSKAKYDIDFQALEKQIEIFKKQLIEANYRQEDIKLNLDSYKEKLNAGLKQFKEDYKDKIDSATIIYDSSVADSTIAFNNYLKIIESKKQAERSLKKYKNQFSMIESEEYLHAFNLKTRQDKAVANLDIANINYEEANQAHKEVGKKIGKINS